jgi:CelD/BcsL family acetyltransferase involved in cellulose biosynthesis
VWVERNGLLTADGELDAFASALMGALDARGGWERLEIDGFLPAHAEALRAADPRLVIDPKETPTAELAPATDVVERMSSGTRRRIRQTLKQFGELELEWASGTDRARAILDELAVLHELRHGAEGGVGAFASERFTAFHRDLIGRLGDRAAVVRISRGDETVGCLYGLVENGRMLFYQSGLHRYEDNKLRAGVAAHVLFMRACAERGLTVYDFLAPPDRYKRELATGAGELAWGWLDRGTPRGRLLGMARQLRTVARPGNASVRSRSSESRETTSSIPK